MLVEEAVLLDGVEGICEGFIGGVVEIEVGLHDCRVVMVLYTNMRFAKCSSKLVISKVSYLNATNLCQTNPFCKTYINDQKI